MSEIYKLISHLLPMVIISITFYFPNSIYPVLAQER